MMLNYKIIIRFTFICYPMQMLKKSFRIFAVPLFQDNYSYVIQTSLKQPLMLVDPANPQIIMECLKKYFDNHQVSHILYTHKHWDHAGGSQNLYKLLSSQNYKLQVISGVQDSSFIKTVTKQIVNDQQLIIGSTKVKIYKVPCHTRGHIVYHLLQTQHGVDSDQNDKDQMVTKEGKKIRVFRQNQCAFTGDTLFCGAIGRFFEGTPTQMYNNLKKLYENISKDCPIYNGHEYTLQSLQWAYRVQPQNTKLKQYISQLQNQNQQTLCTLPTTMTRQSQINLFIRAAIHNQNKFGIDGVEYLRILRQAKNNNSQKLQLFK